MSVLQIQEVSKIYRQGLIPKKTWVLDRLTVSFPLHKCTGLFGHNGAGKTTLIRLIFGISRPSAGTITLDGANIQQLDKSKVGYMPEVDKTASLLTPFEILRGHCALFAVKDSATRIDAVLHKVGLLASKNKKSHALSKGMGRRLAFAQAIIHQPHFLILDEPFAGLDPLGRSDMHSWINEQKQQGTTVILCSHELKEAYALCDEYNIIRKGRLVYSTMATDNGASRKEGQFAISISVKGTTVQELTEQLEQLASRQKLPAWQGVEQGNEQVQLQFADYSQAASWLAILVADGFTIGAFQTAEPTQDELLKYFDLEEQVA